MASSDQSLGLQFRLLQRIQHREKDYPTVIVAENVLGAALRVRHQAQHIPFGVPDAGDSFASAPGAACQDLAFYCGSQCTRPATAAADCEATAGAGDDTRCAAWSVINGLLCRP